MFPAPNTDIFSFVLLLTLKWYLLLDSGPIGATGQGSSVSSSVINAVRRPLDSEEESPLIFPSCECLDGYQPIPEPLR